MTCNLTIDVWRDDDGQGRRVLGHAQHQLDVSFSELGQDLWVAELFPSQTGFWLEIGAWSAFQLSNTVVLEERGWTGISVKPFPQEGSFEARAGSGYAGCHKLVTAVVLGDERDTVFAGSAGGNSRVCGGVIDFHLEEGESRPSDYWLTAGGRLPRAELVSVKSRTAHSILQEYLQESGPCMIHYMSLDSEGSEIDILQTFPFHHYLVASLTVEAQDGRVKRDQLTTLMDSKGFIQSTRSIGRDVFFLNVLLFDNLQVKPDSGNLRFSESNLPDLGYLPVPACKLKECLSKVEQHTPFFKST